MSSQKDALTEALVKGNQRLSGMSRLEEEMGTWRSQHTEDVERLQRALAHRDQACAAQEVAMLQMETLSAQLLSTREGPPTGVTLE